MPTLVVTVPDDFARQCPEIDRMAESLHRLSGAEAVQLHDDGSASLRYPTVQARDQAAAILSGKGFPTRGRYS